MNPDLTLFDENTDLAAFYLEWLGYNDKPSPPPVVARTTYNALTPYHAEKWGPVTEEPSKGGVMNHTTYNLFALRTRITPGVKRRWPNLTHRLVPVVTEEKIVMEVQLRNGAEFVPLSLEDRDYLENLVSEAIEWEKDACWLLDSERELFCNGIRMESEWLNYMMEVVPLPSKVCYKSKWNIIEEVCEEYKVHRRGGAIYVTLNPSLGYDGAWQQLQMNLVEQLYKCRMEGWMLLDPRRDSIFISHWELVPVETEISPTRGVIYKPTWYLPWIGSDPVSFLLRCYHSSFHNRRWGRRMGERGEDTSESEEGGGTGKYEILLPLGTTNYAIRHSLAALRKNERLTFIRDTIPVEVGGIQDLQRLLDEVHSLWLLPSKEVALLDTESEMRWVKDILRYEVRTEGEIASAEV